MWKTVTALIREEIYYSLVYRELFPEEQKAYRRRKRGTNDLLYTEEYILKKAKTKRKNMTMAKIYNKKSYNMVP